LVAWRGDKTKSKKDKTRQEARKGKQWDSHRHATRQQRGGGKKAKVDITMRPKANKGIKQSKKSRETQLPNKLVLVFESFSSLL
jgi:hypothetical protein